MRWEKIRETIIYRCDFESYDIGLSGFVIGIFMSVLFGSGLWAGILSKEIPLIIISSVLTGAFLICALAGAISAFREIRKAIKIIKDEAVRKML